MSFAGETRALMTAIMEAPYPRTYHSNALTVFIMARSLGASVEVAYAVQGIATLAAIAVAIWLWLPGTPIDTRRRALITATLAVVATPYGYTYDMIPTGVALVYLFAVTARPNWPLFAAAWLFPLFAHMLNHRGIGFGVLMPVAVAAWMLTSALRGSQRLPASAGSTMIEPSSDRTRTVVTLSR
jgi:hypothetical protein